MSICTRLATPADTEAVVRLSLLAWAPVFASFRQVLGPAIYAHLYPEWQTQQREVVERALADTAGISAWVAEIDGTIAGFVVYTLKGAEQIGEVYLLAVHPEYQRRGVATVLNALALAKMREAGVALAIVETGGDPGHAPARRAYEKAGYTPLPIVRYFQRLDTAGDAATASPGDGHAH